MSARRFASKVEVDDRALVIILPEIPSDNEETNAFMRSKHAPWYHVSYICSTFFFDFNLRTTRLGPDGDERFAGPCG